MTRANYSEGKRRREEEKARKKREKAERLRRNRERGGGGVPVASVEEIQVAAMEASAELPPDGGENREDARDEIPVRLFVGGLSWGTQEPALEKAFAAHGRVASAVIVTDRDTGRSRGFGFVTMLGRKSAMNAIRAMDGQELDGRMLKVSIATERNR